MKEDILQYLVPSGKKVDLKNYNTTYKGQVEKETGKLQMDQIKQELSNSQEKLYAANSHSLLVVFQAMDAAGKDSAIQHVMSGLNPQGCQVYSFKTPTSEEYDHDFLWRHYRALPERGRIGIHNRSHYENVLISKVHPEYILNEKLPAYTDVKQVDKAFWKKRYDSIKNFEKHLYDNGTAIVKIFLHVSKTEQKKRLLRRIEDPEKNWKFAAADLKERKLWRKYMQAYEEAISATTTKNSPWYIVPADKKWYARLIISEILKQTLKELQLEFPVLIKEEQPKLAEYKALLMKGM